MDNKASHQVLIIEGIRDRYQAQANGLIEAGYAVESLQPGSIEQLEEFLVDSRPDIVLYGKGENMPDLESVTALLTQDTC